MNRGDIKKTYTLPTYIYPNTPLKGACAYTGYKRRGALVSDNRRMRFYSDYSALFNNYHGVFL